MRVVGSSLILLRDRGDSDSYDGVIGWLTETAV
jgi:hypothetical protein